MKFRKEIKYRGRSLVFTAELDTAGDVKFKYKESSSTGTEEYRWPNDPVSTENLARLENIWKARVDRELARIELHSQKLIAEGFTPFEDKPCHF